MTRPIWSKHVFLNRHFCQFHKIDDLPSPWTDFMKITVKAKNQHCGSTISVFSIIKNEKEKQTKIDISEMMIPKKISGDHYL